MLQHQRQKHSTPCGPAQLDAASSRENRRHTIYKLLINMHGFIQLIQFRDPPFNSKLNHSDLESVRSISSKFDVFICEMGHKGLKIHGCSHRIPQKHWLLRECDQLCERRPKIDCGPLKGAFFYLAAARVCFSRRAPKRCWGNCSSVKVIMPVLVTWLIFLTKEEAWMCTRSADRFGCNQEALFWDESWLEKSLDRDSARNLSRFSHLLN